ncbi:MAG: sialidase family protein [Eubacteriales bacterium]|nr:sialidase family protein [Eubacteriales bacterium]
MRIEVSPVKCIIGDEVANENSAGFHFPGAEVLSDGTWYFVARKDKGMNDPYGSTEAVKYNPVTGEVTRMPAPNERDLEEPGKTSYSCYVSELSPNELIAVFDLMEPRGHKTMFDEKTEGMCYCELRITRSHDNGLTWEPSEPLSYKTPDLMVPSRIYKTKDGIVGFNVEMHNHWEEPYREPIQARFIYSTDGGRTFDRASFVPHEKDFLAGDARTTIDKNGRMCVFFWGYDLRENRDLAIYRSFSEDGGLTFSHVEPINLKKQITSPFYIDDDTYMCIYQERFSEHPGLYAALSYDGGMNWDTENAVPIFVKGSAPKSLNAFDSGNDQAYTFGYSTLTKISDDEALCTFWNANGGSTAISFCTLKIIK